MRRKLVLTSAVLAVWTFAAAMPFAGTWAALLFINARAGCFPWSAAEVEYHPRMTICPGQTARGTMSTDRVIPEKKSGGKFYFRIEIPVGDGGRDI
jgi:hypothetical protein